jgi:hypothetical protein
MSFTKSLNLERAVAKSIIKNSSHGGSSSVISMTTEILKKETEKQKRFRKLGKIFRKKEVSRTLKDLRIVLK